MTNDGRYYSLDANEWQLLSITRKTDSNRGRVHVGDKYVGKTIAVFVSDEEVELGRCGDLYLIPQKLFIEVRKTRDKGAEGHAGEALKIQKNGDLWTTYTDKFVKVFVKY